MFSEQVPIDFNVNDAEIFVALALLNVGVVRLVGRTTRVSVSECLIFCIQCHITDITRKSFFMSFVIAVVFITRRFATAIGLIVDLELITVRFVVGQTKCRTALVILGFVFRILEVAKIINA